MPCGNLLKSATQSPRLQVSLARLPNQPSSSTIKLMPTLEACVYVARNTNAYECEKKVYKDARQCKCNLAERFMKIAHATLVKSKTMQPKNQLPARPCPRCCDGSHGSTWPPRNSTALEARHPTSCVAGDGPRTVGAARGSCLRDPPRSELALPRGY